MLRSFVPCGRNLSQCVVVDWLSTVFSIRFSVRWILFGLYCLVVLIYWPHEPWTEIVIRVGNINFLFRFPSIVVRLLVWYRQRTHCYPRSLVAKTVYANEAWIMTLSDVSRDLLQCNGRRLFCSKFGHLICKYEPTDNENSAGILLIKVLASVILQLCLTESIV